jgi:hypothetical protein
VNESEQPGKQDDKLKLDDSPTGLHQRWMLELHAAKEALETFHEEGDKVVAEFRGEGKGSRLNLFFADVQTKSANLSGVPKVRARRRFADALDDVARVSATCLDRLLNSDIERESDGYRKALANAKGDWLRAGLGQVRMRYVVETEETTTADPDTGEAVKGERKTREDVETDYVKWRRWLFTPAEAWEDVRAVFYGLDLSREEWDRQFPGRVFHPKEQRKGTKDEIKRAFGRAEVWEIWDKDSRRVLFLSEQHDQILKVVDDPLGLPGFFPSPEPLAANVTSSRYVPRATYYLAKDQYDEAHELQKRVRALVKQVKVCGAYDGQNEALGRILDDAYDGKLVPVKNFASMMGKDGVANAISLLPIKETVEAIIALSERLALVKREIYEITGQSDIMRGAAAEKATATEQRIKARFGSTRIQSEQDELARFASDAQRIRAHIIAKHFDAETIVKRSNIAESEKVDGPDGQPVPNMELIGQAVEMLKSDIQAYRVDVDAESLAMTDFDAVQQENMSLLEGTAKYFAAVAPMATSPDLAEFFASIYQTTLTGMRGAERIEPVVDRFIAKQREKAAQPPAPPPPDPKVEQVKAKMQQDAHKAQLDAQGKVMDLQMKREEIGMRRQEMAMEMEAKGADLAMKREGMALEREAMHEGHVAEMERTHMGMVAAKAATDQKLRAAKAKPKGGDK